MNKDKHIPQGYKDSPLGIIPKEWEVKRLGDSFTFKQGVQFPVQEQYLEYKTGLIRFIRIVDLTQGDEPPRYVKDPGIQHHISEQDLFMIRYGTPGVIGYGYVGVIANNLFRLIPKQEIDKYYFYQYFKMLEPELMNLSCSSSMAAINFSTLERVYLRYPTSLQEQNRVSNILRTWDTAIEIQSELIEKLKLRKRALMQQLLTGKKRLPGFSGEWKVQKIKDHFMQIEDRNDGKGHIPMTISAKYGLVSQKDKFDRVVAGNSLEKYTLLRKGDFAYNKGNSNLYEMGCIYRLKEESAVVPFVYICFRTKDNTCSEFYKHFFINHGLDSQLKRIITSGARGDGLLNVNSEDFMSLKIPYPIIEEQAAIANVLNSADKEIELANEKLASLQSQKRGLMQQLLTGKKRIKI